MCDKQIRAEGMFTIS